MLKYKSMGTFQNIQRENEQHSQTLIQPQLEVGEEDDEHEKEANHVADKVMKMSDPDEKKKKMSEGTEKIQKMSSGKEEEKMKDEDEGKIQKMSDGPVTINKMSDGNGSMAAPQNVEQGINSTKGNGQSLPADTQQELGSKMNADFSDVNIHTDSNAVQMNKEIGAKAFTHGNDIYFNQGQYNPNSNTGKHLLAHELTHTVQQGNGKTMLNKQQNSLVNDPEEDLGNKLLTQYPQGIPVMIYDTNYGDVFKVQSEQWAKRNNAVGLKGETFVANEVLFGKAIPNEMSRPNQDNVLETLAIDQVITQFGALLQSAVKKAEIKKQSENSNYVPNDNAYKIKTLAIGSHGWCGHTSAGLSEENYIDYIKNISPYLTTDVNVILYACNTATGKD
ncbi:MAG: eCIS core domain-containing protein, partial [Bacteroidia bacterium]